MEAGVTGTEAVNSTNNESGSGAAPIEAPASAAPGSSSSVPGDSGTERPARENRIPISRAEEMWQRREEKIRRDYDARIAEYERRLSPSPQRDDLSRLFRQAPDHGREIGQIRNELAAVRFDAAFNAIENANRAIMDLPGARVALKAAARAAFMEGQDPGRAVAPLVKEFRQLLGLKAAAAAQRREERMTPARKIVPSGRSGWARSERPAPPSSKPSVANKIQAALQARHED